METDDAQEKRNEDELRAWMSWKRICSVQGCPAAERELLRRRVVKTFQNKFVRSCAELSARYSGASLTDEDRDLFVQAFDVGLLSPRDGEDRTGSRRIPYKDALWELVAKSDDPPLKVIRGKLTGPRSFTNGIIEQFIRENYSVGFHETSDGHKVMTLRECSLNTLLEQGDGVLTDLAEDETVFVRAKESPPMPNGQRDSVLGEMRAVLRNLGKDTLDWEELDKVFRPRLREELRSGPFADDYRLAVLLLVTLLKIPMSAEPVLAFCNARKSRVSALYSRKALPAFEQLYRQEDLGEFFNGDMHREAFCILVEELLDRLEVENGASEFLSYVGKKA